MVRNSSPRSLSRRDLLIGAGSAMVAARALAGETRPARAGSGFDTDSFIQDCIHANEASADAQSALKDVLERVMSDPSAVLAGVGEPQKGGLKALYRSPKLTILNIVWAPLMQLIPHEHNMWALIGIYTGREDNIFWERHENRVAAKNAAAIAVGDVIALPRDVVHSVNNPIERLTGAIHVYGGDFFAIARSEWDPETLSERPWDIKSAIRIFEQANDRFFGAKAGSACT